MKHAGSSEALQVQSSRAETARRTGRSLWMESSSQSLTSKLIVLATGMFMVAVIADAPVLALAQSLDPSVISVLRIVTGLGNSSWPLGIGLLLLGFVVLLRRSATPPSLEDANAFRAMLILLMSSVALSGFLASLSKHIIGRVRPSTDPDAMVLEFSFMAFKTGWAAFPSGHATTATAAAVALAICFPRQAWAILAAAFLAALSRALIGVHWLSDCLAGVVLGTAVTVFLHRRMIAAGYSHENAAGAIIGISKATSSFLVRLSSRIARRIPGSIRGKDWPSRRR